MTSDVMSQLIALSHELGRPELDYTILAEGNTSARAGGESFWVKASGRSLASADAASFVRVARQPILDMLSGPDLDDEAIKNALERAKADPDAAARPSVETMLHAVCQSFERVRFVGHTHPSAVNALTCAQGFEQALAGRLFPDEIVVCGPAPVLVPYHDPGVPLARVVRTRLAGYLETYGEPPKMILLQNHGLFALGHTPQEVLAITAMAVKTARILLGTFAAGGPHFLSGPAATRIHTRPDEDYRRRQLEQG